MSSSKFKVSMIQSLIVSRRELDKDLSQIAIRISFSLIVS
jgi:hypothetical protein